MSSGGTLYGELVSGVQSHDLASLPQLFRSPRPAASTATDPDERLPASPSAGRAGPAVSAGATGLPASAGLPTRGAAVDKQHHSRRELPFAGAA